jgi:hypothetical protein
MKTNPFEVQGNGSRLDALRKREASLKAAIAEEQRRHQRRSARAHARLVSLLGSTVIAHTARDPNFKLMLQQVLRTAELDARSRQFLSTMDWF